MNVACSRFDSPRDDEIHQSNDRHFRSEVAQMLNIVLIADKCVTECFDQLFTAVSVIAVEALQPLIDFCLESHVDPKVATPTQADGVLRFGIERIRHY